MPNILVTRSALLKLTVNHKLQNIREKLGNFEVAVECNPVYCHNCFISLSIIDILSLKMNKSQSSVKESYKDKEAEWKHC